MTMFTQTFARYADGAAKPGHGSRPRGAVQCDVEQPEGREAAGPVGAPVAPGVDG
jgi:hypothetical protein